MDLRLPRFGGPIASEVTKVAFAVGLTELLLWALGLWSWISSGLQRWPWLIERYALIFPLFLVILLFGLRWWRPTRSHIVTAGLWGAAAGLIASVLSLILAQAITAPERTNFWNGLRLEGGVVAFLLFGSFSAFFLTLGWLYGAVASLLALTTDWAEARLHLCRENEQEFRTNPDEEV